MLNEIGSAAGQVWKFLDREGASSVKKIADSTGLNKTDIERAIGWLAREDKLVVERRGRNVVFGVTK